MKIVRFIKMYVDCSEGPHGTYMGIGALTKSDISQFSCFPIALCHVISLTLFISTWYEQSIGRYNFEKMTQFYCISNLLYSFQCTLLRQGWITSKVRDPAIFQLECSMYPRPKAFEYIFRMDGYPLFCHAMHFGSAEIRRQRIPFPNFYSTNHIFVTSADIDVGGNS